MLGYTPPAQCMLGYTPPAQCMLGYTVPSASWDRHGYCCRRYASYWNAFLLILDFYGPQQSWGKVMFLHASVILFMGGGGSAPLHAGIHHPPWDQAPPTPGPGAPQSRPTQEQTPPGPEAGTPQHSA